MKKIVLTLLALGFLIPSLACGPDPTLGVLLSGTSWQLLGVGDTDDPLESVSTAQPVVLSFGHGWMIEGKTACGHYSATYEVDGTEFRVADLEVKSSWLSTNSCPHRSYSQRDMVYLDILADVATARLDTDLWTFILKTDDGRLLIFGLNPP